MGKRRAHGAGKRGSDGLTDQQRAYVQARLGDPDRSHSECARIAGVRDPTGKASRIERMSAVQLALSVGKRKARGGPITKEWLQKEMRAIYESPKTPVNEKVKLLDKLGATVQGFYVPVGVHHSGKVGLEDVIRAMGGVPEDVREEKEVLN